jgi:simple sugar transport system permease protein
VTLASLHVLRGITLGLTRLITGRTQIPGIREISEGDWLAPFFSGQFGGDLLAWLAEIGIVGLRPDGKPEVQGIPVSILWWILLSAIATWVLLRTRFGNWIFAVGGDANAARNVGVPVAKVKIRLFMMSSLAAALFASIQVLSVGSADTSRGLQKEFEAIIAVVIGGTFLTGGYGSAIGAVFGSLIFGFVQMGIFYTGIDTDWFKAFMGAMLLVAVLFNDYIRKKATESR